MIPSLYIHIPFCRKKCIYCDFYSVQYKDAIASAYIDSLSKQIEGLGGIFSTIYVGGGTPTILDKGLLAKLLKGLKGHLNGATEFTIEANPESLSEEKIELLLASGVNRLSIGVQSLKDQKLSRLGRVHNSQAARQAVILSSKKGFNNISADMIYGAWDEDEEGWKEELEEVTKLPVTHISCYALTYEKATPLFNALKNGAVKPLEDDVVAGMYEYMVDRLSVRGFKQYEVSNFAKEGCRCRHNLNYWENSPYIGLGASAVSYAEGTRAENIPDVEEYIRRVAGGESLVSSSEKLPPLEMAKETAAVKIRTRDGIDFDWFKAKTGFDFTNLEKSALKDLLEKDLIKYKKDKDALTGVCLKRKGFLFCDTVSAAFL
jgi:oxygen-independent coproporphyrinogen-3 oxidase